MGCKLPINMEVMLMFDKVYNKIGSYCKNQGILERTLGSKFREFTKRKELQGRRIKIVDKLTNGNHINIDEHQGFKIFDGLEELEHTADVIHIAKSEFSKLDIKSIDWNKKGHLYSGVLSKYNIDESSPIIKFALQERLINPIIKYFGFVPVLSYVGAWYSPGKLTEHTSSQLFHCDQADVRQVKVFIHCCDITNEDGALNLIEAQQSKIIRRKIKYRWDDKSQCLPDDKVLSLVPKKDWIAQEGKEGTVALCDTSRCFHFGSRLNENSRDRLVMMFQFLSPFAFTLPWNVTDSLPFSNFDSGKFSKIEKKILGIP